ncbi:LLM class flavin-dependent oxidoreductase [Catenuloplanes atrovinosus]|uniref:F420-dependent oxidoreductase n=1 Tax=Catenuloplanes atrovinosus TaxID=137266 RepID=A0AAE3YM03_9ACTN|nr:LLM class flavin-dependent oxidoreductase [Catenuloplanes atrovinosus]MDR7274644.1 putative F420-dependent oxidoreductase [Catenuloplanes atrovinosus]
MTTFSLQAVPRDGAKAWLDLARRAEEAGFDTLLTADHPGVCPDPYPVLAAAAAVTSRIRLGVYVSNAGIREPMPLASAVATLDLLSGGRARFGIGAGHTPAEWAAVGRSRPGVAGRVRRCIAVAEAVRRLLDGEEVTVDSPELTMTGARLDDPRPVQDRIPMTFGGGNTELLRWAGRHADVVGLSGLGRTLPDGHRHTARWSLDEIDAQVALAPGAVLEALVQIAVVTDDADSVLAESAAELGLSVPQLLRTPFVLVGTEDEIAAAIARHRERWGIDRYVIRAPALESFTPIVARLSC